MARTTLAASAIKQIKGPNPGTVNAGDLTVTPAASDVGNGNQFVPSVNDVLHIQNTHASTGFTATLTSAPDERFRKADITTYALPAGAIACFKYGDLIGWVQPDGFIYINGSDVTIKFWVERQ